MDQPTSFGPGLVRQLRGPLSRAAFARALAVTPQTIYRWELPETAPEARRPRGVQRERLEAFARQSGPQPTAAGAAPAATPHTWVDDDALRVLPALERVLRGDIKRGHAELVQLVTQATGLSLNARAAACFGIALCEVVDRSDARAALLVLGPLLQDAEAGRIDPALTAKLFAVAACCHSLPDALLFDLGRVHAYKARIEALPRGTDDEAVCLASVAALCGATLVGDLELVQRALTHIEQARWSAMPPLLADHVEEFRAFRDMVEGRNALTIAHAEAAVSRAEERGYPLVLARTLARLALAHLDMLTDPELVLGLARRAKTLGRGARVGHGIHTPLALRAEIEALVRLGRTAEALQASAEVDAWVADTGVPAFAAVAAQVRLYLAVQHIDAMTTLSARLRSCELPAMRNMCQTYADFVDAAAAFATQDDPELAVALFERAEAQAARWPLLLRDVLLYRVYAHLAAGQDALARVTLRRAQRFVDAAPSPWITANLRRVEGGLASAGGHWNEGRQLLQAASATFELAKDRCDALLTRYLMCLIADTLGAADPNEMNEIRQELARLGLAEPRGMRRGVAVLGARAQRARSELAEQPAGSARLVVPFQRVAMRGAAPSLILSELTSVVAELFPGRGVRLDEIDSAGSARALYGGGRATGDAEWLEFSDGAGRLLRLGVNGGLEHDERATLTLLTTTAALALEVAMLRGSAERTRPNGDEPVTPELPGFVAASAEMRALRVELGRLARSRSTVIITGESGSGKEVVARAIHDLSERSQRAYIAFNCATVPRELFEGQLFGYRRGAFTGATSDHPGVIRAANGGTLFLDEIAELPLDIQPKLLRFLENSEVFPLGERAPVRVDVRVLAATHRDLAQRVRDGHFREDLYYRLQVIPVFIPPLRDRRADIPVLARHFLRELTSHGEPPVLAPDALAALLDQSFPGNVRELKNILERALAYFPDQPVLRAEHLRLRAA